MKKVLLFDVDYTLLDSDIIKTGTIDEICSKFGVERKNVENARDKYYFSLESSTDVKPDELLGVIQKELNVPLIGLKEAYYNPSTFVRSVYPDTARVLPMIDSNKFEVGIFSEGLDYYQKFKLEASGIGRYFNSKYLFVKRRKKSPAYINTLPALAIVVDDRIDVINRLKKVGRVVPIWLNRQNKKLHPEVKTIFILDELIPIINEAT